MNDEDLIKMQRRLSAAGDVADWQLKTVNVWPKLFFPDVVKHKIVIAPDECKIVFHFTVAKKKKLRKPQLLAKLEVAVQGLLGDTWLTTVKVGRSTVYSGTRKSELRLLPAENDQDAMLEGYNPHAQLKIVHKEPPNGTQLAHAV